MNKIIDVTQRYEKEIDSIKEVIEQLKSNRYYELTNCRADGSLYKNICKLEDKFHELLYKIEYGKNSDNEQIGIEVSRVIGLEKEK